MKLLKALVLTFTALFLFTGCYTQLQYSKQMKKVTDARYGQENTSEEQVTQREDRYSGEAGEMGETEEGLADYTEENDIPIYYKNYYVANWWNDCACSPYGYNYYSDYGYYDRFHFGSPFYYSRHHFYSDPYVRWKLRHHRGFHFGSSFSMTWRWGYHHPHHFYGYYYDPFLYNYYGYYGHPVAFNNFYFYGRGFGHFNNGSIVRSSDNNRRYGPRSIGTNRTVTDDTNRARERQSVTNSGNRAADTSAPRTVGTSRTRSSTDTVTRTRTTTSGNSVRTTRTRSVQRKKDDTTTNATNTRVRSRGGDNSKSVSDDQNRSRKISLPQYVNTPRSNEQIRQRVRSSKVPSSPVNVRSSNSRERKTFLNRVGSFINNTTSTISNSTTRTRSSSVKARSSSVKRSSSSVSRSKSNSSSTRSRGSVSRSKSSSSSSSSGSRSRSGGGSSSDRSRGGN